MPIALIAPIAPIYPNELTHSYFHTTNKLQTIHVLLDLFLLKTKEIISVKLINHVWIIYKKTGDKILDIQLNIYQCNNNNTSEHIITLKRNDDKSDIYEQMYFIRDLKNWMTIYHDLNLINCSSK